jgi:copper(I)-binding protein
MSLRHVALTIVLILLVATPALATSIIEVMHPWARPTIPNRPGVVYLGIHNLGDTPDRLVGARADGIGSFEIHLAEQSNGVMTMSPIDAVDVPAGGMAHLGPGGLHLMMFDIAEALKLGDTLDITLIFESAGDVAVAVPVSNALDDQAHHDAGHQHGTQHQHTTTGN